MQITLVATCLSGIIILSGILFTHRLSLWRDKRTKIIAAADDFRKSIHSAIGNLLGSSADFFTLDEIARIKASVVPLDLACRNLSPFLSKSKRLTLNQAMQKYQKACQEDIPDCCSARHLASLAMQEGKTEKKTELIYPRQIFITHIDRLLSFADKT